MRGRSLGVSLQEKRGAGRVRKKPWEEAHQTGAGSCSRTRGEAPTEGSCRPPCFKDTSEFTSRLSQAPSSRAVLVAA